MAQTYGATVPHSPTYAHEDSRAGESSALLGNDALPSKPQQHDGHASLISCISNLCNTIIGSGMLTFPLAFASAGIIPGMLTCIFSGTVAAFGLYLLSRCATYTPHRHASFTAISILTWPKAAVYFDAAIAIKCFGVSTSYLIIIKGLMPRVVASIYHAWTSPDVDPPDWALSGQNWLIIFILILTPLCFLRRLDSLRHTSYVALFSVVYLVIIVISCYFKPIKGTPPPGDIALIHFTPNFVSTFPVQVFAFTCAQNLFPLYNEVRSNTQERMNIIIGSSIGAATLTYEIIGLFGYLTFGTAIGANIIAMYPSTTMFIAVGQLAIVILVMFSYPLQVHPCRNCLDKVLVGGVPHKPAASTNEDDDDETEDPDHQPSEMSTTRHVALTTVIVVGGLLIAYFVNDLQMVLSFVGSTGSTTISFILPGLFYWKLTRYDREHVGLNRLAFLLAIYGFIILVFCLGYNIAKIIYPDMDAPAH